MKNVSLRFRVRIGTPYANDDVVARPPKVSFPSNLFLFAVFFLALNTAPLIELLTVH